PEQPADTALLAQEPKRRPDADAHGDLEQPPPVYAPRRARVERKRDPARAQPREPGEQHVRVEAHLRDHVRRERGFPRERLREPALIDQRMPFGIARDPDRGWPQRMAREVA